MPIAAAVVIKAQPRVEERSADAAKAETVIKAASRIFDINFKGDAVAIPQTSLLDHEIDDRCSNSTAAEFSRHFEGKKV